MSQRLAAALIRAHEGYRRLAYRCPAGWLTVGYGRNVEQVGVTEGEAETLLQNDLRRVAGELDQKLSWWRCLDEARQAALVDMAYNLGAPRLLQFQKMLDALRAQDWERASREALNSRWALQVGRRAERVAQMFRTGAPPLGLEVTT